MQEKLYYYTGAVVWWAVSLLSGSWLGLKAYDWRKKHFHINPFGIYALGINVVWSAYWQRSDYRHNVLRTALKNGFKVRRCLGLLVVTRPKLRK